MNALQKIRKLYKTQGEMAEALGVAQATVSDWLSGRKKPSTNRVKELAKRFGFPKEEFRPDVYGNDE